MNRLDTLEKWAESYKQQVDKHVKTKLLTFVESRLPRKLDHGEAEIPAVEGQRALRPAVEGQPALVEQSRGSQHTVCPVVEGQPALAQQSRPRGSIISKAD